MVLRIFRRKDPVVETYDEADVGRVRERILPLLSEETERAPLYFARRMREDDIKLVEYVLGLLVDEGLALPGNDPTVGDVYRKETSG